MIFDCQKVSNRFWEWQDEMKDGSNGAQKVSKATDGFTYNSQCSGIVWRSIQATFGVEWPKNGWSSIASSVMDNESYGKKYYTSIDFASNIGNPQIGDVINYESMGTNSEGKPTGHVVMWLDMGKTDHTNGPVWVSDCIQCSANTTSRFNSYWSVYSIGVVGYDGKTKENASVPIPRMWRLKEDIQIMNNGQVVAHHDAVGGSVNGNNSQSSYAMSNGSASLRGSNYGGRSIKEGNPNTVYQLSSYYQRDDVLNLSSIRRGEFEKLRQEMIDETPNRDRKIITSEELYQPSILKSSQRSKQDRTATQIRKKDGESA